MDIIKGRGKCDGKATGKTTRGAVAEFIASAISIHLTTKVLGIFSA